MKQKEEYMEEMKEKCGYKDFSYWNGLEKGIELGANWQKEQDQSTIELHAMLAGMNKMKEEMMANAIDGKVLN